MNAHIRNIDEHGTFIRDNYKDNSKLKLWKEWHEIAENESNNNGKTTNTKQHHQRVLNDCIYIL
jgi:hypothetical protein